MKYITSGKFRLLYTYLSRRCGLKFKVFKEKMMGSDCDVHRYSCIACILDSNISFHIIIGVIEKFTSACYFQISLETMLLPIQIKNQLAIALFKANSLIVSDVLYTSSVVTQCVSAF